jgi:hypothetical protein
MGALHRSRRLASIQDRCCWHHQKVAMADKPGFRIVVTTMLMMSAKATRAVPKKVRKKEKYPNQTQRQCHRTMTLEVWVRTSGSGLAKVLNPDPTWGSSPARYMNPNPNLGSSSGSNLVQKVCEPDHGQSRLSYHLVLYTYCHIRPCGISRVTTILPWLCEFDVICYSHRKIL